MRSGSDQVEIFNTLRPIVKSKPCRLPKNWGDGKTSAMLTQVIFLKVSWAHEEFFGDRVGKVRE